MVGVEWLEGGITAVPGILAAGLHCGIKVSGKKDLALIYSSTPAVATGVFTTNRIVGAPVKVSREHLKGGVAQAIVASSGNANVATGEQGVKDAREMADLVAQSLRIPPTHVLVASTGIIGQPLPIEKIRAGVPKLVKALSPQGGRAAAEAIMTTDTRRKEAALKVEIQGRAVTFGGVAKGAGMIAPQMATMFCFLATDAALTRDALDLVLRRAVERSFNRITIDGDRSTSDTVFLLANGLAENRPLAKGDRRLQAFQHGLEALTQRLALMIVQDGEGATKLVEVRVSGARSHRDALTAARAIATSLLVKTALAGEDPNWGRIIAALGASGAQMQEDKVAISYGDEPVVEGGRLRQKVRWERVKEALAGKEVLIQVDVGLGLGQAHIWTSDLTEEYIKINARYTS